MSADQPTTDQGNPVSDAGRDRTGQTDGVAIDLNVDGRTPCTADDAGTRFCTPQGVARCDAGSTVVELLCPCVESPARCDVFTPSNVGDRVALDTSAAHLNVANIRQRYWFFNTDTGAINTYERGTSGERINRLQKREAVTGPSSSGVHFQRLPLSGTTSGIGVFSVRSLNVAIGYTLIGVGSRPLVIVARDTITIDGTVDVGANPMGTGNLPQGPGPGGHIGNTGDGQPGAGPGGGGAQPNDSVRGGAGGGAFGGPGGRGSSDATPAGAGGTPYGTAELVPLLGGSGGGSAQDGSAGSGGHGGGAVQLVAGQAIHVGGSIGATGSGGGRQGGGGAGGGVLLEAPQIEISGFIGANGGGGGTSSGDGQPGRADAVGAAGGSVGGGDGSDANGIGGDAKRATGAAGGGGGGRIRINTALALPVFGLGITPTLEAGPTTLGTLTFTR